MTIPENLSIDEKKAVSEIKGEVLTLGEADYNPSYVFTKEDYEDFKNEAEEITTNVASEIGKLTKTTEVTDETKKKIIK
jgi:hypothetical protein